MSLFTWECALACGLLVPAQTVPAQAQPSTNNYILVTPRVIIDEDAPDQPGAAVSPRPAVDEEIEVMRSLLLRKLTAGDGRNGRVSDSAALEYRKALNVYNHADLVQPLQGKYTWNAHGGPATVEGVYVDGHGVLFAVTLPGTMPNQIQILGPSKPPRTFEQVSDWEQARRQLVGETVPAQTPPAAPKPPLSDVLLHLLAENGKHFAHLRDDERLTIAVTFRDPGREGDHFFNFQRYQQPGDPATDIATIDFGRARVPDAVPEQKASDLDLLIELHLKQGQNEQAIAEIEKALKQLEDRIVQASTKLGPSHPTVVDLAKAMNSLHAKQASALLAAGKVDAARDVLATIRGIDEATAARQATAGQAAVAPKAGPRLPAKLTISATKRQLDLVGSGKMTFEAFAKEATVKFTGATKPSVSEEKK